MPVDRRARTGFGARAAGYDRARPSYPMPVVRRLARTFALGPASTVVDLAAGTGKLTRPLAKVAGEVIAVEPSRAMRAALAERVPEVTVLAGRAEKIPLGDAAVDAVFVGQAFHWFDTRAAGIEIARVLRGGGGLALLWNRERWSVQANSWLPALRDLVDEHRARAGPFPAGEGSWESRLRGLGLYRPLRRFEAHHVQVLGPVDFVALVGSWSWIANLPAGQRRPLLERVRQLVADRSRIELAYVTQVFWTRRL